MHPYRSHTCADLNLGNAGETVRLSGWVHRKRDHGGLLFIDLRDHYGITQVVVDGDSPAFADAEKVRSEWVIRVDGVVKARDAGLVNPKIPTGEIEVYVREIEVLGAAEELPLQVFGEAEYPEETRLKYRFLDLRREGLHANIMLRAKVIASLRRRMEAAGVHRVPDADPDRVLAGGGAGFPGAVAAASGQVLRAAAGAAAVQAADHGGGVRPVFSDRALLPRRGSAGGPVAGGVLPARHRDELRHARRCFCCDRAGDARGVRGVRRRAAGDAGVSEDRLPGRDAVVRVGQAGLA